MNLLNRNQTNGHQTNGHQTNGHQQKERESSRNKQILVAPEVKTEPTEPTKLKEPKFDQAVVLRQSPQWARAVALTIMAVTAFGIAWASIAKIEQVVPARGQLKPQGTVKEVQVPINGVVQEVYVKDGDKVDKDQLLLVFDSKASKVELASLQKVRLSLSQENQFYRTLMSQSLTPAQIEAAIAKLNLPKEVAFLARNRAGLLQENQLFRVQLGSSATGANLNEEQRARLRAAQAELNSRATAARLEIDQLTKQLNQNQLQLGNARAQLSTDKRVLAEIRQRNELAIAETEKSLEIDREILSDIEPLLEEGALAKLQLERQRQAVSDRYGSLVEQRANGKMEYETQRQQMETRLAEIEQLLEEQQRLRLDIAQSREELTNTVALSETTVRDRIADNQKRIAEIDTQLTKLVIDNDNQIAQLDGQISRAQQNLAYQEVKAPVAGTVFDLQASPGFVPQPSQAEALLKIVPADHLVAEVDITNRDIGFVQEGMPADVRIDSFPFNEFGDIKGKVKSIGKDALPPDELHREYRFPTKVSLDQQFLEAGDRQIALQSGMSVSVNIKVREDRTVLSLFTELFTEKVESLKNVR